MKKNIKICTKVNLILENTLSKIREAKQIHENMNGLKMVCTFIHHLLPTHVPNRLRYQPVNRLDQKSQFWGSHRQPLLSIIGGALTF